MKKKKRQKINKNDFFCNPEDVLSHKPSNNDEQDRWYAALVM